MTMLSEDTERVVLELPEDDYSCTAACGCDRKPVWWLDCLGCGNVDYACEKHRQQHDQYLAGFDNFENIICTHCRTRSPYPLPWKPL